MLMDVLSSRFGVDGHINEWFHSYLSSRTRIFFTPVEISNAVALICRVPQGSVFWSLLFITYTEDEETQLKLFLSRTTYADDTQLLAHM